MEKVPFTAAGLEAVKLELTKLKSEDRPAVIKAIAAAREHGDLSENAEYHAAREKQSFIEGRVAELEDAVSRAYVVEPPQTAGDKVTFGARVTVADETTDEEKQFDIVGPYEADINQGRVSTASPLAKALIGKSIGDSAEVTTPSGKKSYEIIAIDVIKP